MFISWKMCLEKKKIMWIHKCSQAKKKKSTFYILFSFNFLKCSHKLILESYGFVNAHS